MGNRRRLWSTLLALLILVVAVPSVHAAVEEVSLDVTYAIRPDGDIDVRYELDWRFPSKDNRGINFEIVTREPFDDEHDVTYTIDDLRVSSPTGANTDVARESRDSYDGAEYEHLRIGNPDVRVGDRDQTYVIEYRLGGGLRTFDGEAELYLDVTGRGYPDIRDYAVTVTAPEGVTKARCLVGSQECHAEVTDGVARMSGSEPRGTISAVAGFDGATVESAEPILVPRRIDRPEPMTLDSTVEVTADGVLHGREVYEVRTPTTGEPERMPVKLPHRMRWDDIHDQAFEVLDMRATVDGQEVTVDQYSSEPSRSHADVSAWLDLPDDPPATVEVVLEYEVAGAVFRQGDFATVRWPLFTSMRDVEGASQLEWTLPDTPTSTAVMHRYMPPTRDSSLTAEGAVLRKQSDTGFSEYESLAATLPLEAFDDGLPTLEPSLDLARERQKTFNWMGGWGSVVLVPLLAGIIGHFAPVRDERFRSTPPGVPGRRADVGKAKSPTIPVRFEPPSDRSLTKAGIVWDRERKPSHLAAELVGMASRDEITLTLAPDKFHKTSVTREHRPAAEQGDHVVELWETLPAEGAIEESHARKLREVMHDEGKRLDDAVFATQRGRAYLVGTVVCWVVLPALAVAMMAGVWTPFDRLSTIGHYDHGWLGVGVLVGSLVAGVAFRGMLRRALSASGSVLRDQLAGFKLYLETAEQHQLQYEEGRDIFREYLPWAVLFGITERWTAAVRTLARTDGVAAPDTSYMGPSSSLGFSHALLDFERSTSPSSSSGGGGSSSGFSSSSSGGGGGGGTGASSW